MRTGWTAYVARTYIWHVRELAAVLACSEEDPFFAREFELDDEQGTPVVNLEAYRAAVAECRALS